MRAAGLVRGAYHYGRPSRNAAADEVDYFLALVADLQPGDLLALDLEDVDVAPQADLYPWTLEFLSLVTQRVGFQPELYSGTWYLAPHNCLSQPALARYGLWLSSYQASQPAVPQAWPVLAMWQFTNQASIPGIGLVDASYFLGDLAQLRSYGKPMPGTPSVPIDKTVLDAIVTCASQAGVETYPDGSDIDAQAPGQPPGVSHRVFIRELMQQIKAYVGA